MPNNKTYKASEKAAKWMQEHKQNVDVVVVELPNGKMFIHGYYEANPTTQTVKKVIEMLGLRPLPGYKHSLRAYSGGHTIYVFPDNLHKY
jgi:hypothetical protein